MLIEELFEMEEEISKLKSEKTVQETEIIEVNKRLPLNSPIGRKELSEITDEIFSHPSRNIDVIKLMRDRGLIKPDEKDNKIKERKISKAT